MTCDLCRSKQKELFLKGTTGIACVETMTENFFCTNTAFAQHGDIVRCAHCGLVYADPYFSEQDLISLYRAVKDEHYIDEREGKERSFAIHVRALKRVLAENARIFEIGSYAGFFLNVARDAGFNVQGVEVSDWAVAYARDTQKHTVHHTHAIPPNMRDGSFDAVVALDVLEHIIWPSELFEAAHKTLTSGGYFYISTLNHGSLTQKLWGNRWHQYMLMHKTYFSKKHIREYAQKYGFSIVWMRPHIRYFSLGYFLEKLGSLFFKGTKDRRKKGLEGHKKSSQIMVPFIFFDLVDVLMQKIEHKE